MIIDIDSHIQFLGGVLFQRLLQIASFFYFLYILHCIVKMMRFVPSSLASFAAARRIISNTSTANATPVAFAAAMRMFSAAPAVKVSNHLILL